MFRAGLLLIIRRYLYIQQLVYVMRLCRLAASRIGSASCCYLYRYTTIHGPQNIKYIRIIIIIIILLLLILLLTL
jgi:hypothetical protein